MGQVRRTRHHALRCSLKPIAGLADRTLETGFQICRSRLQRVTTLELAGPAKSHRRTATSTRSSSASTSVATRSMRSSRRPVPYSARTSSVRTSACARRTSGWTRPCGLAKGCRPTARRHWKQRASRRRRGRSSRRSRFPIRCIGAVTDAHRRAKRAARKLPKHKEVPEEVLRKKEALEALGAAGAVRSFPLPKLALSALALGVKARSSQLSDGGDKRRLTRVRI